MNYPYYNKFCGDPQFVFQNRKFRKRKPKCVDGSYWTAEQNNWMVTDDLKKVNDTLGHEMGDIMILELCKAPAEGRSASDLLHEADLKMYEDKIRTKEEQKAKEKQEKK